jgi:hypothetical protein
MATRRLQDFQVSSKGLRTGVNSAFFAAVIYNPVTGAKAKSTDCAPLCSAGLRIKETKPQNGALKPAHPRKHCYSDKRRMFFERSKRKRIVLFRTGVNHESTKKQCFSLYAREDSS